MQTNIALVYSESIEKLRGVLEAMQNAGHKREKLERRLREQLQSEICRLKGTTNGTVSGGERVGGAGRTNFKQKEKIATPRELHQQVLLLEAEVAKVGALMLIA